MGLILMRQAPIKHVLISEHLVPQRNAIYKALCGRTFTATDGMFGHYLPGPVCFDCLIERHWRSHVRHSDFYDPRSVRCADAAGTVVASRVFQSPGAPGLEPARVRALLGDLHQAVSERRTNTRNARLRIVSEDL